LTWGPLVTPEGWAGLVLVYETALALDDENALRREVDEIWQHFIVDVTKARYGKAIIAAKAAPANLSAGRPAAQFLFTSGKGGWSTSEREGRAAQGLDPQFVRDFIARYDWLVEHHDGVAAALYLAAEWTATLKLTESGKQQTVTLDRNQFVAAVQAVDATIHNYKHQREIVALAVDPDGRSARIESREAETFERGGKSIKMIGTSVDLLTLIRDCVQFTRSFEEATMSADGSL
jgi:hypothetical protein